MKFPSALGAIPAPAASPKDDGQWVMAAKNYASTRYSALTQIGAENVNALQVEFTFSTGVARGHEAAPLVVGDTMYVVTPYPNILYALNLRDGEPRLRWAYEPKPDRAAQGVGWYQARYLCKVLRKQFPDIGIVVGCWGCRGNLDRAIVRLRSAGAHYVTPTLLGARGHIDSLADTPTSPAGGQALLEPQAISGA